MTSNRSRSSIRETSHSRRSESVIRPTLPLNGTAIACPIWMTSCAGGSSPHGAVMMRTSWPRRRSSSYDSRMYEFAPPGRGYAYGLTIPTFMRASSRSSLPHPPSSSLHGIAHHRAPLLPRDAVQMLAQRPVSAVGRRRAFEERVTEVLRRTPRELGPGRPDELGVVRVARARLRRAENAVVEPRSASATDAPGVRRIAQLDAVDVALGAAGVQCPERSLADG